MREGERIGPLRIERLLGIGGMGEVWLARDERLERRVAVKLLPPTRSLDPAARGRMLREARAASALKHPGIVTVHDIGEHDGRAYIVMEHVEGETFDALVKRRGRLPPREAVALFGHVADAVAVAHTAGILHRDLKAQNLMIDEAGRVKVLDFGLSKRTDGGSQSPDDPMVESSDDAANAATVTPEDSASGGRRTDEPETAHGARMGTPGWAPPELIDGRPSDARSDVFSLGVVLYHLLCGRLPFLGTSWSELRAQIDERPPPPSEVAPEVPRALDAVVLAALEPDPARRPDSARALHARARAALGGSASRGWIIAAAAGTVVVCGLAAVLAIRAAGGPRRAAAPAPAAPDAAVAAAKPRPPEPITRLGGCAYSPHFLDDDTLAFDLTDDSKVDLYTVDLGADPVQRTSLPGWEWRAVRGGRDDEIVFLDQGADYSVASSYDLRTGAITQLFATSGSVVQIGDAYYHAPQPHETLRRRQGGRDDVFLELPPGKAIDTMTASPDGRHIALLLFSGKEAPDICVTPSDRGALRCFEADPSSARPAWSAKSDALYIDGKLGIDRIWLDGRVEEQVVPDSRGIGGLTVSPSGAELVYSGCTTRGELVDVVAAPDAALVDRAEALNPAVSPDGRLAYTTQQKLERLVMLRELDGTERELARFPRSMLADLAFSHDGRQLAWVLGAKTGPGIYVTAIDGGTPVRITDSPSDRGPVFTGDALLFTRVDEAGVPRLMRIGLDGTGLAAVGTRPRRTLDLDRARQRVLLASPDGRHLYWWDLATRKETPGPQVPLPAQDIAISPDGRWLASLFQENGRVVHRLALDGKSRVEVVHTFPEGITTQGGAIDDQGHPIVSRYLWAGELFRVEAPAGSRW